MPSLTTSIYDFIVSTAPIFLSLFHSYLAVLQSILAFSHDLVRSIIPLEKSFIKLAMDMLRCGQEFLKAHFGHLIRPNSQHYVPHDYPYPSPLKGAIHGCSDFSHLKDCRAGKNPNASEGDAFNSAQLQALMAVSLVDLRLSTARSNLQHQLTMRALIACTHELDHGLQDYRGELDKRIQEARLEVKHLESQLKSFQSPIFSPPPSSFISFNPISWLLSRGRNTIKARYKPLNLSPFPHFMSADWRGTQAIQSTRT